MDNMPNELLQIISICSFIFCFCFTIYINCVRIMMVMGLYYKYSNQIGESLWIYSIQLLNQ